MPLLLTIMVFAPGIVVFICLTIWGVRYDRRKKRVGIYQAMECIDLESLDA